MLKDIDSEKLGTIKDDLFFQLLELHSVILSPTDK
jgi:hypothetical protein